MVHFGGVNSSLCYAAMVSSTNRGYPDVLSNPPVKTPAIFFEPQLFEPLGLAHFASLSSGARAQFIDSVREPNIIVIKN